ncbi:MAG: hypothetical protein ACRDSL_15450 [Pseudonocardiaceae bacterium]
MSQEAQGGLDAGRQQLSQLRQRMAAIKAEVAAEVEAKWTSPYRSPEVFDTKVNARLAAHEEYRSLQDRVREAEAALAAAPGAATGEDSGG